MPSIKKTITDKLKTATKLAAKAAATALAKPSPNPVIPPPAPPPPPPVDKNLAAAERSKRTGKPAAASATVHTISGAPSRILDINGGVQFAVLADGHAALRFRTAAGMAVITTFSRADRARLAAFFATS